MTEMFFVGVRIHIVKEILGHASITTTLIYAHALEADRKKAIDTIEF